MLARLKDWLDHRIGYRKFISAMLLEHIPGGAKWRYVWGSALAFVFLVQLITGVLLMTAYSPSDATAWGSVYYIQYEMDFGWLILGLHHFGSQTMVVLIGLHMLQVVIAGAHLAPREVNWWLGLLLMGCVLGLSLTGYLLPWDQKGYWATQVATNIAGSVPVAGEWTQKIIVGGPEYGHHTLTRFYALHVGILPPLVILLIILHLAVFRRHGITHPNDTKGKEGWFWPDQAFRDLLVSLIIFGVMLGLVIYGWGNKIDAPVPANGQAAEERSFYDTLAHAGRDGRGANLDAPADPSTSSYPARPEWYFLFLFQLLKYFEGPYEIVGTVIIPFGVGLLLFILPLLGYGRMRKFGHAFGIIVVVALLNAIGMLTLLALREDLAGPKAEEFQTQMKDAEKHAVRAVNVAKDGIPASGARDLLRHDPLTQGERLFKENCSACHNYKGVVDNTDNTASDLADWGTESWIRDLLRDPGHPRFFGKTHFKKMTEWVKETRDKAKNPEALKKLDEDFDQIAKWLAGEPRNMPNFDQEPAPDDVKEIEYRKGYAAFADRCNECHPFAGEGGSTTRGPDFTGYASADWMRLMIMAPHHPARYGLANRNAMPIFRDLKPINPVADVTRQEVERLKQTLLADIPEEQADRRKRVEESMKLVDLSDIDRELIIRWLMKDYRVVFGGEPITGPVKR